MPTASLIQDQTPILSAAPEGLAGPPRIAPVARSERINAIDVLRGFALLGILIMNIPDFALPPSAGTFPLITVKPVFSGPHWHLNTGIWFARWIFAEGKMRALFSMLFGAGVLLLTGRAEARGAGLRTADIFLRRNLWLTCIGGLHCFLIWNGDILFSYGLTAVLLLFPLRNCKPQTLFWAGGIILVLSTILGSLHHQVPLILRDHHQIQEAQARTAAHQPITDQQRKAIDSAAKRQQNFESTRAKMYQSIADHQKGYLATRIADAPDSYQFETEIFLPALPDVLGMMLLGMALFRIGFLTGSLSSRTYALTALISFGISLPVIGFCTWYAWKSNFDLFHLVPLSLTYEIGRVTGALGNAAVVILLVKHALFRRLFGALAAVGQTALSNYLLTSILMQTLFVWSPLHWFGYLAYYQIYLVMLGMWAINLIVSPLWLRYFQFGPVEWLWRSLTYWKPQLMRLDRMLPMEHDAPQPITS